MVPQTMLEEYGITTGFEHSVQGNYHKTTAELPQGKEHSVVTTAVWYFQLMSHDAVTVRRF